MGEISSTSKNRSYYEINGQQKCILKYVKGEENIPIKGLEGYLQDITLKKGQKPNGDIVFSYRLVLTEERDPSHEDEEMVLSFKEGTYLTERIINTMLGIDRPEKLTILVYPSNGIKDSPGVMIKIDNKPVTFKFDVWDDQLRGYKGIPGGKPEGRIQFWRDQMFKEIYVNLLGREWDGEIELDYALTQGKTTSAPKEEIGCSVDAILALNTIKKKLPGYEAAGDHIALCKAWADMVEFIQSKSTSPGDAKILDDALLEAQTVLDRICPAGSPMKLEKDGTYGAEDLPF